MDDKEIRLKIVESLVAAAPRADIRNVDEIVERCKILEKYVKGAPARNTRKK